MKRHKKLAKTLNLTRNLTEHSAAVVLVHMHDFRAYISRVEGMELIYNPDARHPLQLETWGALHSWIANPSQT